MFILVGILGFISFTLVFSSIYFMLEAINRGTTMSVLGDSDNYKWTIEEKDRFGWEVVVTYNALYYVKEMYRHTFLTRRGAEKYVGQVTGNNAERIKKEQEEFDKYLKLVTEIKKKSLDMLYATKTDQSKYDTNEITDALVRVFPDIKKARYDDVCPVADCQVTVGKLMNTIFHLNDTHKMSREDIASWLEETDHNIYAEGVCNETGRTPGS